MKSPRQSAGEIQTNVNDVESIEKSPETYSLNIICFILAFCGSVGIVMHLSNISWFLGTILALPVFIFLWVAISLLMLVLYDDT